MPNPGPVLRWHGHVRLVAISLALTLPLTGCLLQPGHGDDASDELLYLDRATNGSGLTREAMWKDVLAARRDRDSALHLALLQSVPDHPGYDPVAAQRAMRNLLAENPPERTAALLRLRLEQLRSNNQCLSETEDLRRRLAQVVDIERQIDGHAR